MFIAGLMVGRTPEYLGKKIQAAEMKLVVLYILAMPLASLGFAAASVLLDVGAGRPISTRAPRPDRDRSTPSPRPPTTTARPSPAHGHRAPTGTRSRSGLAMLIGRFFLIIPALAIAGSLVRKQQVPVTAGHVPDRHAAVRRPRRSASIVIVAGLTFFPALALGPIVEHLVALRSDPMTTTTHRPTRSTPAPAAPAEGRAAGRPAPGSLFDPAIIRQAVDRQLRQARPAHAGPQPGHVRGRGRLGAHHDPVLPRPRRSTTASENVFAGLVVAVPVVHRAVRQLRRGDGRGPGQGPGRHAAQDPRPRPSPSVRRADGSRRRGAVVAARSSATCAS